MEKTAIKKLNVEILFSLQKVLILYKTSLSISKPNLLALYETFFIPLIGQGIVACSGIVLKI